MDPLSPSTSLGLGGTRLAAPLGTQLHHVAQNQNGSGVRIASFRTVEQATPLGPAHGFLQYNFVQPALLLEALLALSLNRWLDMHTM